MDKMSSLNVEESVGLVIVGAGIAGLAAAKTLEKAGYKDYILLEAQNKIGGRINSVSYNSTYLELGAQFLHGNQSDLAYYCQERDLLSDHQSSEGEGLFVRDDGTELDARLIKEIKDVVEHTLAECEGYATNEIISRSYIEPNIGKLLRTRFSKYLKMKDYDDTTNDKLEDIFDWHVRFLVIDNACLKLNELSVKKWGNFEVTGGPEYSVFKTSYSSLTNSILLEIESQKVRLNSPVQKVVHSTDSKCTTILMNGAKIKSNAVILTPSLGYLKKHYKSLIEPPLPLKQSNAIKNLGFGLINKVFIDFGEPWWEPGTKGFQLIWRRKVFDPDVPRWTKDLTGFDVLVGHKAVILGWVGGEGAYLVENESENQVAKDCCKVLEKFLRRNIPEVKKCIRTKWLANQYVLGSYSHISMKCDEANVQPEDLMEPVWSSVNGEKKPVLLIAGEAASKHYYSTTHGAYDTGTKQANVFLEHWTCPPFELPN